MKKLIYAALIGFVLGLASCPVAAGCVAHYALGGHPVDRLLSK